MEDLTYYLQRAVNDRASDLFFIAGSPVCEKLEKVVQHVNDERLFSPHTEELVKQLYIQAGRSTDKLMEQGDDDFSFAVPGLARFRVNTYRQRGSLAAVVRVVAFNIPNWQELNIPEQVINLANQTSGMILVTGTAGSGKSTTQACIIDQINKTRACHIVTLEDPIEYLHRNQLRSEERRVGKECM